MLRKRALSKHKVYLLHSEGPDDVLRQELGLYQRHLDVSVDLGIVGPVFTALHLRDETSVLKPDAQAMHFHI